MRILPRIPLEGPVYLNLRDNVESHQHRKRLLIHCTRHLLQFRIRYILKKPEMTHMTDLLEYSIDIAFTRWIVLMPSIGMVTKSK